MPGHYKQPKSGASTGAVNISPTSGDTEKDGVNAHNPFEGQTVIRNGQRVPRTPSTKPLKE